MTLRLDRRYGIVHSDMTSPDTQTYDCVIIGGGPAGSTVGTLLADQGHRVLILERDSFPRHHVGESLMPQTFSTFERLGMLDKLRKSDFPRKQSVQFVSGEGKDSQPFYFTDRDPNEWSITWQVARDQFDCMMLENAEEHGAEIRQNVRVVKVLFDGDRAIGVVAQEDESTSDISARVVVDATGTATVLSRQLGIRRPEEHLKNGAIYAYYKGAQRDQGRNSGATIIIHTPDKKGWFWFIPLPDDVASVGLVAPPSHLFTGRGDDPLATFESQVANCPGIERRLSQAKRVSGVHVTSDFSYRSTRVAGHGWVLVGDAYAFLDPIYSSGVFLALKSGEFAADAIHEALAGNDLSGERLGSFGDKLAGGIHLIKQLVYAFYDESFSFGRFSREYPQYHDHIVRLLIGDVFNDDVGEVFDAMKDWVKLPQR